MPYARETFGATLYSYDNHLLGGQIDSLEQQTTTLRQVRLALDTVPVQI